MDRAGDQLFARPGLSENQDGRVGGRDALNLVKRVEQCRTAPDHLVKVVRALDFLLEVDVFRVELTLQPFDFAEDRAQRLVGLLPLQFGAGPARKRLQHRDPERIALHRLVVDDHQVADDMLRRAEQRQPDITLCAHRHERRVIGKQLLQVLRIAAHVAGDDAHARRARSGRTRSSRRAPSHSKTRASAPCCPSCIRRGRHSGPRSAAARCCTNDEKKASPTAAAVPSVIDRSRCSVRLRSVISRDTARMRCWPSLAVSDRADRDVPPFGCADGGGTQTDEAADAALSGRVDGAADDLPRLDGPQFRPEGIAERAKIADVQRLHAAGVHRQQTAVEIEHLDAIQAALDQPRFECLAGPQRFFGHLVIRDRSQQSGPGITKFQLADRLPAEHTQGVFLFGRQLSRDAVEYADRSQCRVRLRR